MYYKLSKNASNNTSMPAVWYYTCRHNTILLTTTWLVFRLSISEWVSWNVKGSMCKPGIVVSCFKSYNDNCLHRANDLQLKVSLENPLIIVQTANSQTEQFKCSEWDHTVPLEAPKLNVCARPPPFSSINEFSQTTVLLKCTSITQQFVYKETEYKQYSQLENPPKIMQLPTNMVNLSYLLPLNSLSKPINQSTNTLFFSPFQ